MDTEHPYTIVNHRCLDGLRRGWGPVAEHVIDEFVAGNLPRRCTGAGRSRLLAVGPYAPLTQVLEVAGAVPPTFRSKPPTE